MARGFLGVSGLRRKKVVRLKQFIQSEGATTRSRSLFRYSPALVLIAIVIADAGRLSDPDLWGHLRFGQATLSQAHPPWRDIYSYSVPGHRFIDHEWLTEVCMAWMYNRFGVIGLKIFKFLCTGSTIVLLAVAMGATDAPTLVQFGVLIASAVAIMPQMQFRPQLFTFALLSAMLAILAKENRERRAPLWLLVPMMAVWANLHGGFIMGLATLGVFSTVACAQDLAAGRGLRRAWRLLAVGAGSALATLVTPYGAGIWRAVLHALANPYTGKVVMDWQSLPIAILGQWYSKPGGVVYIGIAVILFAALGISLWLAPTTDDLPLVGVAIMMIVSTFVAIRNLPIAVIAVATPLTRHLGLAVVRRRARLGIAPDPSPERSSRANQIVVTVLAAVIAIQTGLFSTRIKTDQPYPAGAVRFMKEHQLHGKVLSSFTWGEYLIWHLEPGSTIFIDGRYDTVFPISLIGMYLRFQFALPGGAEVLEKYPPDFVLVSPTMPAFKLMESRAGWKLIYRDSSSALFARADSAAARIPGVPVIASAQASSDYFP